MRVVRSPAALYLLQDPRVHVKSRPEGLLEVEQGSRLPMHPGVKGNSFDVRNNASD